MIVKTIFAKTIQNLIIFCMLHSDSVDNNDKNVTALVKMEKFKIRSKRVNVSAIDDVQVSVSLTKADYHQYYMVWRYIITNISYCLQVQSKSGQKKYRQMKLFILQAAAHVVFMAEIRVLLVGKQGRKNMID